MQQIINFVIRNKTFLLFLLLFGLAVGLTIQSHSYHKSKFITSSNSISGGILGSFNSFSSYFDLKTDNQKLIEENKLLRLKLYNSKQITQDSIQIELDSIYEVISADVYKNSYSSSYNYLTINKGKKDGVNEDYGVITDKGIIGIIDNSSNRYSRVISILNKNSKINAQLKSTNHFGSLTWDAQSPNIAQLVDVSKFAPVKVNDTIITGGQSAIFPKGIGIGTILSYEIDQSGDTYIIQIQLFNDMTDVGFVYIINNKDASERQTIEEGLND